MTALYLLVFGTLIGTFGQGLPEWYAQLMQITAEAGGRPVQPADIPEPPAGLGMVVALGLLFAATAQGVKIPAQLSMVGLDNIDLAYQVTPALTTIAIPRRRLGADAMTLLLRLVDRVGSLEPRDCQQVVTTELVVRQSTGPAETGPLGEEAA